MVDKLAPEANIMFFAACSLVPPLAKANEVPVFLQMWDIHDARFDHAETRDRAIILPLGNDVHLQNAASMWRLILFYMTVQRMTVQQGGWPILCVLCKGWAFLLPDAVSSSFPFPRRNPRAPEPALSVVEGFAPHSGPPTAGYPDFGALPWATATGAIRSEPG